MNLRVTTTVVLIVATVGCIGIGAGPTPTATPDQTVAAGESHVVDGVAVTVTGLEAISNDSHAEEGEHALHVQIEAENQASESQSAPSYLQYRLISDGEQFSPNEYDAPYHDATQDIVANTSASGYVEFIVSDSVAADDIDTVALVLEDGPTLRWTIQ